MVDFAIRGRLEMLRDVKVEKFVEYLTFQNGLLIQIFEREL